MLIVFVPSPYDGQFDEHDRGGRRTPIRIFVRSPARPQERARVIEAFDVPDRYSFVGGVASRSVPGHDEPQAGFVPLALTATSVDVLEKHRKLRQSYLVTDTAAALLLNERQKQCLRLVYENLEAKEIARTLSLSPHTVNEHLRDARRALGVPRSMQAARMLAEAEGDKRLVPKPIGVDRPTDADDEGDGPEVAVPEVHVSGNRYHLSMLRRLGMVVALAIGVIVLGGALLGTTDLVARLLTKYRVDIADGPYKR